MKAPQCPFEDQVLQAIESRGDLRSVPELPTHVANCPICSDLVVVASAFDGARDELVASAHLPDAGQVWRRTQMRAQREAIRAAGRPITAVQVITFGAAMGLIGASFGATSTTFQAGLAWLGSQWASIDTSAVIGLHGVLLVAIAVAVVLLPAAVYVALLRE